MWESCFTGVGDAISESGLRLERDVSPTFSALDSVLELGFSESFFCFETFSGALTLYSNASLLVDNLFKGLPKEEPSSSILFGELAISFWT